VQVIPQQAMGDGDKGHTPYAIRDTGDGRSLLLCCSTRKVVTRRQELRGLGWYFLLRLRRWVFTAACCGAVAVSSRDSLYMKWCLLKSAKFCLMRAEGPVFNVNVQSSRS
jgi:hypothetical protein